MLAHGVVGAEERGLLVKGLVVVANKDAGDVDDAVEEEYWEGDVWGEVPALHLVGRYRQGSTRVRW